MYQDVNGIKINYKTTGAGRDLLILHGWGGSIKSFEPVHKYFENYFRVTSIDFPGFGDSPEPPQAWTVKEYAQAIDGFMTQMGMERPIVIGHSFGGRVIIWLAPQKKFHKIILVDSAGIKPKRPLMYYIKVYTYKAAKNILALPLINNYKEELLEKLKKQLGSADYQQVSGIMRETLVKVVNEDLRHLLPQINVPTLLIWGEKDTATPVEDGKLMEQLIPDAGLVVFKDAGHFAYLDKLNDFLIVASSFLKNEMGGKNQ